jgi:dihydrofolate reductase
MTTNQAKKEPGTKARGNGGRRIVAGTFVTLDGVMQAPGGPDEDRDGGFKHGGWSVNYWDDMMGKVMETQMSRGNTLLLGRKTYEIFAAHWPNVPEEPGTGAIELNNAKKYVASRSLKNVEWKNSELLKGDVPAAVRALKQQPGGEIQVTGSGNLLQTLLKHDLVDELNLWIFPIVLGTGKRLFADGAMPGAWKLTDAKTSTTGVTIQRFQRAGDIPYGSFALADQEKPLAPES